MLQAAAEMEPVSTIAKWKEGYQGKEKQLGGGEGGNQGLEGVGEEQQGAQRWHRKQATTVAAALTWAWGQSDSSCLTPSCLILNYKMRGSPPQLNGAREKPHFLIKQIWYLFLQRMALEVRSGPWMGKGIDMTGLF